MSMDNLSHSPSTSEFDLKALSKELGTIQELDKLLEEKQAYLNLLTRQRLALQRQNETHEENAKTKLRKKTDDHESFLLTMQQGLFMEENISEDPVQDQKKKKSSNTREPRKSYAVKKNYDKSDFVNRNKAMGPEARYFSTLTVKEQERVESILTLNMDEEENQFTNEDNVSEVASTIKTTSTAYTMDDESNERIQEIHQKLKKLVPRIEIMDEYDDFPASASGTHTPVGGAPLSLRTINEALEKLKVDPYSPSSKPLSQQEMNSLVLGCLKEQMGQETGRMSPSAEC